LTWGDGVVERRGVQYHRERLAGALREEIETIVEGELADPRIGLANVTEVHLADDGRSARVMVAVAGPEDDAEATLAGLNAAGGFIRREVAERLHLRRTPELIFCIDRGTEYQTRITELLKRTNKRR
jgi:ribosome-binding factor A